MSLKFLYLANARIPTEKAHGLQIIKMCEALAQQGADVELFVPYRRQSAPMHQIKSIWEYYEVMTPFSIKRLASPDFIRLERVLPARLMVMLYIWQSLIFGLMALLTTAKTHGVYYTRDWYALFVLALTKRWHRKGIFFEAHEMHGASYPGLLRWLMRHIDGLVVITHALHCYYEQFGITSDNILTAADGIDARRLSRHISREQARTQLGLPLDKKVLCYTGHLFRWKGVYTLVEAMGFLPEDYALYLVGGMERDCRALQQFINEKRLPRVTLLGHVPYSAVPPYLAAADVLVLPNSAIDSISRECTSPLKLFEYMGAQRPIVASDLPSLREVLTHRKNAWLVEPDNPQALATGILELMQRPGLCEELHRCAYQDVQNNTWELRAKNIINFFEKKS